MWNLGEREPTQGSADLGEPHLTSPWREDVMAAITLLCELGAPAVTALVSPMKPVPQPALPSPCVPCGWRDPRDPTASVRSQHAHADSRVHGLKHTQAQANPGMPSSRCGHCDGTGRTSRGGQERTHAATEGWGASTPCSRAAHSAHASKAGSLPPWQDL